MLANLAILFVCVTTAYGQGMWCKNQQQCIEDVYFLSCCLGCSYDCPTAATVSEVLKYTCAKTTQQISSSTDAQNKIDLQTFINSAVIWSIKRHYQKGDMLDLDKKFILPDIKYLLIYKILELQVTTKVTTPPAFNCPF